VEAVRTDGLSRHWDRPHYLATGEAAPGGVFHNPCPTGVQNAPSFKGFGPYSVVLQKRMLSEHHAHQGPASSRLPT